MSAPGYLPSMMMRFSLAFLLILPACSGETTTAQDLSVTDRVQDQPAEPGDPIRPTRCRYVESGFGDPGTTPLNVEVIANGLDVPWSIDWFPNGDLAVTERGGRVFRIGDTTRLLAEPESLETGEGGLLGLALHPDFGANRWLYLYMTKRIGSETVNVVERWLVSVDGGSASFDQTIVPEIPARRFHNGGRLRFGPDGKLYIGTGDAGEPDVSQDPQNLAGKLLRVNDDGTLPDDNPWPGSAAWLIGIRNTQAFDWLADGRIVLADHGPSGIANEGGRRGHDEVTVAYPGDNLGWPGPYGCEMEDSMVTPIASWQNSLPPGGLAVVDSDVIPAWAGDVLIGVLGFGDDIGQLHRLSLDAAGDVVVSEVYLQGDAGFGRLRDVAIGPDGAIYATSSGCDGRGSCGSGDVIVRITAG